MSITYGPVSYGSSSRHTMDEYFLTNRSKSITNLAIHPNKKIRRKLNITLYSIYN